MEMGPDFYNPSKGRRFKFGYDRIAYGIEEMLNRMDEQELRTKSMDEVQGEMRQEIFKMMEDGTLKDFTYERAMKMVEQKRAQREQQVVAEQEKLQQSRMAAREDYLQKEYRDIYGTEWATSGPAIAGSFGKYLTDPLTIVPFWKTTNGLRMLGNAMIGGSITGFDIGLRQMVSKGEISGTDAAVMITAGAALPLFVAGGGTFLTWFKGKIANRSKVTPDELLEQGRQHNVDIDNPEALATKLNEQVEGTPVPVTSTIEHPINPYDLYGMPVGQAEYDIQWATKLQKRLEAMGKQGKLTGAARVDEGTRAREIAEAFAEQEGVSRPAAAREAAAGREAAYEKIEARKQMQEKRDFLQNEIAEASIKEDPIIQRALVREIGNINRQLLMHMGGASAGALIGGALDPEDPVMGAIIGAGIGGMLPVGARFLYKPVGKFGEGVTEAGGSVGAAQAMAVQPIGMGTRISHGARELGTTIADAPGRANDALLRDRQWGSIAPRPSVRMDALGETSRRFSAAIQEAEVNTRKMANGFLYRYNKLEKSLKAFGKDSKPRLLEKTGEWKNIAQVMEGTVKAMNPRVAKVAKFLKTEMDQVVDMAVRKGIYTLEQGKTLKAKGYWPRIYDEQFLQTNAGKELWIKQLSEHGWDDMKELESALGHILYGQKDLMDELRDFVTRRGDKYLLSREAAERLLVSRRKATDMKRSHHLERPRTLNFPYEVLEPFLIKDPKKVITEYSYDVSKRFAFVEKFGIKDEFAEAAIKTIREEVDALHPTWGAGDHAYQTYYTAAGDTSKSAVLRNQAGFSDTHKRITGALNAVATWKLTLAPILNVTQVHILGPSYMAKSLPLHTVARNWHKGIASSMTKEGQDYAMRTAAVFETSLMQVLGESAITHTVWGAMTGKELQGAWKALDWLNDPAKFLRVIQFVNTEKMNRIVGANMGKAHFESLLAKKVKIEAGGFSPRKEAIELRKFNEAMEEMGLPTSKKVWQEDTFSAGGRYEKKPIPEEELGKYYNELDAEHAGLIFSDKVNFVNDVTKLPLWWRSNPYLRLGFKFKSFSYHFGGFMVDNVVKPMRRGNFKPLATFVAVGSPLGWSADQLRRWVAMDDREFTKTEQLLRAWGSIGGMGIALDAALGLTSPYGGRVLGTIAGPVGGDIFNLIQGMRMSSKKAIEHSVFSKEAAGPLSRAVVRSLGGGYPGKQQLLEELEAMYKSKKKKSSGLRRGNR